MKVTLLDSMGNDLSVVNAARVSFHKVASEYTEKDAKLIKYLASHDHWTPFSQVTYQVRISAPIFIARQWFKHQIGITRNEVSRRYVSDEPEFYVPETWRGAPVNGAKQGSAGELDAVEDYLATGNMWAVYDRSRKSYDDLLSLGVCPEQARMVLPQGMYTEWVETGSIAAAARIIKQRVDHNAQAEIRELAMMLQEEIKDIAPVSLAALME